MSSDSSSIRNLLLRSISDVGHKKAIGYLPIATLENILNLNKDKFIDECINNGLYVKLFVHDVTCIKSGAVFVCDYNRFEEIITKFKHEIIRRGWIVDVDFILNKIACEWFDENDPIMPMVRALYGEGE